MRGSHEEPAYLQFDRRSWPSTKKKLIVITVVWDTWLKAGAEAEGLKLTRQIWSDMRSFDGYLSHQILVDEDVPGHVIAIATWRSRADADAVRGTYKDSETIRQLTPLLARPRERWVTREDGTDSA